jgi:hypothetical protein
MVLFLKDSGGPLRPAAVRPVVREPWPPGTLLFDRTREAAVNYLAIPEGWLDRSDPSNRVATKGPPRARLRDSAFPR